MKRIRFYVDTTAGNSYIVVLDKTVKPSALYVHTFNRNKTLKYAYKQIYCGYTNRIDVRRFRGKYGMTFLAETLLNGALTNLNMPNETVKDADYVTE